MRFCLLILLFVFFVGPEAVFGQAANTVEFGKNRVQYHRKFDQWLQYESENFITYWYGDARNVGQFAVQMAEYDFLSVQKTLEHRISDKMEIIVYTDITDFKQSNIGSEESFQSATGQTKIAGNKIFVYFDGNHQHLRKQIREGIASVFINALLFGSNLQEMVQNAVMLNMPVWFKQGLIAYCGETWSVEADNELRDIVLSGKYESFYELAEKNPRLAGHSFWNYVASNYGSAAVPNLIYLARINKNIGNGFLYVIGTSYESLLDSWWIDNNEKFRAENEQFAVLEKTQKTLTSYQKKHPLTQVSVNPKLPLIAYASNEIGKWKVYIEDTKTGKKTKILSKGYKNNLQSTDFNYPLLAWKPNGEELSIIFEQRDVVKFFTYDTKTRKEKVVNFSPEFQRVYSMAYLNNNDMVISAATKGFSDIFIYKTKTTQNERITNDIYDDLDAQVVNLFNRKGIVFTSNRPDTSLSEVKLDSILPTLKSDVFYYDLEQRPGVLVRVTQTPELNERGPIGIDSTWIGWLSEQNGVYNKQIGHYYEEIVGYRKELTYADDLKIVVAPDSILSAKDSIGLLKVGEIPIISKKFTRKNLGNAARNIESLGYDARQNRFSELMVLNGKSQVYWSNFDSLSATNPKPSAYFKLKRKESSMVPAVPQVPAEVAVPSPDNTPVKREEVVQPKEPDTTKVNIDQYEFQSEFDENESAPTVVLQDSGKVKIIESARPVFEDTESISRDMVVKPSLQPQNVVHEFKTGKIVPYQLKFRTDFVSSQLDNSPLFGGLDSYTGFPQGFSFQPLGILLKANFKDLLEDYEIEGGMRFPTAFNGSEFFLWYKDKKRKLDKTYALYRRSLSSNTGETSVVPQRKRVVQTLGYFRASYPLDIFTSIRASATMRLDKISDLSTDNKSLNKPTVNEQRLGGRLEYVFDNSIDVGINMKHGTRYKVYAEFTKRMQIDLIDKFVFDVNAGYMAVVGLDFRHYLKLDKYSILAARAAGAASFGNEKVLYFLGGVDNWLFPKFNTDIPIPQGGSFAFQTQATSMRGFHNNIRNGNNYGLINVELRSSVFRYLFPGTTSSFIKNFQLIGFFDAGTAWSGFSPFNRDNPLNTLIIKTSPSSPISLKVNYFREPIVMSYGIGMRTLFLGYFVRVDYGWGIETRVVQKPVLNLAIGMDF